MNPHPIQTTVERLAKERGRFAPRAYFFTLEALNFTLEAARKSGHSGHITGQQLLEGIQKLAVKNFGFLGRTVFQSWGIQSSGDFGKIVFDLVSVQLLSKQETDSEKDFETAQDFSAVFEGSFIHEDA